MNYFSPKSAAARYARGRPYFHPLIVRRISEFLSLPNAFPRALDVGCGTGLSALALKDIAIDIVGVDASPEMLAFAHNDDHITYIVSIAEQLPFCESAFDLVTVSQAFHWLDINRFFAEARRVLRANAWLVIYDNYFSSQMEENDDFQTWHSDSYLAKYPSPQRPWASFTVEDVAKEGLHLVEHEKLQRTISFSLESLVDYLVTQSNVITAVEGGGEKIREVRRWMKESIAPLFGNKTVASFLFSMPIWYLQRVL